MLLELKHGGSFDFTLFNEDYFYYLNKTDIYW